MGNITNISNHFDQKLYVRGTTKTQRAAPAPEETGELRPTDRVSISKPSRDFQLAKQAVESAPDIRSEKVDPIKRKIAEGSYEVNAESVAERLIGSHVSEWI